MTGIDSTVSAITAAIARAGFAYITAGEFRELLPSAALEDWTEFAASWNQLSVDTYMADGGRYRRRRFAAFAVSVSGIARKPHQPHYQSRDYNPLNGGIERWFDPITEKISSHPLLQSCLRICRTLFDSLTTDRPDLWHVEVHQFRIEAGTEIKAQPTPEGLHRDGVDWVLVMLMARVNIAEGVTTIHDINKRALGHFTLTSPFDAAFVDDSRVYHGVTAVEMIDPSKPAYRDVLVVTFRRP
jgi:hypothetical protein